MDAIGTYIQTNLMTDAVNFLVYAAIAVLFIVCVFKCVLPVMNTKRLLRRAARQIKKGDNKQIFQDEKFLGGGVLMPHWGEYLNNLLFADGEFHNPSSVEDYINEDTAIFGPGRAGLGEAMPGLMVSLGFLGTLIGITTGLRGFDMSDSEAVMRAIRQLVPGMQYAFLTSIVGVIASITATLLIRIVNGSALNALSDFYATMNRYAGVQSVDPLTQLAIYQQEQTSLIHQMAQDITGPMTDRLAAAIDKSVAPLKRSLDDFINFTTRDQMRAIDTMVQRFMSAMNETLDHQFTELASTIESTNRISAGLQNGITTTVNGLKHMSTDLVQVQRMSEGLLQKFDDYMTKVNASYQMVDEGYARIAANVEHLEIIARQQNGYLQSVGKLQTEIVKAMDGFQSSSDAFMTKFSGDIAETKMSLGGVAKEMKSSAELLAESQKKLITGINKDMDRTYNQFFENTNKAVEQFAWMVQDVKGNIDRLPDLLDSSASLYANQADRLTDALRRCQDALDSAVDQLVRR